MPTRWLSVAPWLVPLFVITTSVLLIPLYFPTNDDSLAQQIFAGSISGEPLPYVTFMGYALCWLVSRMFIVVPQIPWWTILHFATIYLSLTVFGVVTLRGLYRCGCSISTPRALLLLFIVECGVAMPLIGRLQFTTTGSFAVSVAVYAAVLDALLIHRLSLDFELAPLKGTGKGRLVARPVPILLFALGFSYRSTCGYLGIGFWLLALMGIAYANVVKEKERIRFMAPAFVQILCAGAVVLVLTGVNAAAYSSSEWQLAFDRGNAYAGFTDFPTTPYSEDPSLYERVGWDEALYNIASDYWFFLDPRMTTPSLQAINEGNAWGPREMLEHPVDSIRDRLVEMREAVPIAYAVLCAGVVIAILVCAGDRRWKIATISIVLATAFLLGYLFFKGRLPLRAFLSVVLPAVAVFGAYALYGCSVRASKEPMLSWHWSSKQLLVFIVALLPAIASVYQFGWMSEDYKEQASRQPNIDAFQEYAWENPETLFIYDYWAELTPQTVWDVDWPSNATQWGGWAYVMPWFDDVMREQGFGGVPTTDTLLNENALFVNKDDYTRDLLVKDMRNLYGPGLEIEQVDTIGDGLRVYRFYKS